MALVALARQVVQAEAGQLVLMFRGQAVRAEIVLVDRAVVAVAEVDSLQGLVVMGVMGPQVLRVVEAVMGKVMEAVEVMPHLLDKLGLSLAAVAVEVDRSLRAAMVAVGA